MAKNGVQIKNIKLHMVTDIKGDKQLSDATTHCTTKKQQRNQQVRGTVIGCASPRLVLWSCIVWCVVTCEPLDDCLCALCRWSWWLYIWCQVLTSLLWQLPSVLTECLRGTISVLTEVTKKCCEYFSLSYLDLQVRAHTH